MAVGDTRVHVQLRTGVQQVNVTARVNDDNPSHNDIQPRTRPRVKVEKASLSYIFPEFVQTDARNLNGGAI